MRSLWSIALVFMGAAVAGATEALRGAAVEHRHLMAVAFYDPKVGGYAVSSCLNSDRIDCSGKNAADKFCSMQTWQGKQCTASNAMRMTGERDRPTISMGDMKVMSPGTTGFLSYAECWCQ